VAIIAVSVIATAWGAFVLQRARFAPRQAE
jgi:hypothetical protein